jgi:hypothetical protein
MKLIFALTAGRTGTAYLAELLRLNAPEAEVHHEVLSYESFGVETPDTSHMHTFNTKGNIWKIRVFWRRKLAKVLSCRKSCYVETAHMLMKAGLVENMVAKARKHELHFIRLTRDSLATVVSYHQRGDFLNKGNQWMWYLDERYPRNMVSPSPLLLNIQSVRLWYLHEIAARAAFYRQYYGDRPHVHFHTVALETLNDRGHVAQLLRALGLPANDIIIPPKQNAGPYYIEMDDRETKVVEKLIRDTAFDPEQFAQRFIAEGRHRQLNYV